MQQIAINTVKIKTQLFKRQERVFVSLPKSRHTDLEKFNKNSFVKVLIQNDKHEKIFSFAARLVRAKVLSNKDTNYRVYVEVPLTHRSLIKDWMFEPGSINIAISNI